MAPDNTTLQALALCFLPPFLTEAAQQEVWPKRIKELLDGRWLPALSHLSSQLGHTDEETDRFVTSAVHYFIEGPRLPFDPGTA